MFIWESLFIWAKPRKTMQGYSRNREDFLELLYSKYYPMEEIYNGCLTLPEDLADARDYKAEATIELDYSIKLPNSFSLGEWIYSTNYQWAYGSCTANSTSHWVQVLCVKSKGVKPIKENLITPSWRDLWTKMGHDLKNVNDSGDYVEKAVSTALKEWISNEEWWVSNFDWYATNDWDKSSKGIETIKRYLFNWNPVVWCLRWNKTTWNELSAGELKTEIPIAQRNGGHAVCCVGWDESWLWFVNSWKTNDWKGLKSRFHVSYNFLKQSTMFNWRYWLPFKKEQANNTPEYLKRKSNVALVIKALKKIYPEEWAEMKKAIEEFSKVCRKTYPELDKEIPKN